MVDWSRILDIALLNYGMVLCDEADRQRERCSVGRCALCRLGYDYDHIPLSPVVM